MSSLLYGRAKRIKVGARSAKLFLLILCDYADENNLAGVVVCGSLYLAAEARPLLLKEAEK